MTLSNKAQEIYNSITEDTKMGDLKKLAKVIKKDHELAMELWSTEGYLPRMLSVLIMDKSILTQSLIEGLVKNLAIQTYDERNQITEWLMANQLMKSKATILLLESWANHELSDLRRLYWYYQARLRWMGKVPIQNTLELMDAIEANIETEQPEVQWTMNFCAAWIGVFEPPYRKKCIELGERLGLYKDYKPTKGCTPSYLPDFIRIECAKRN